MTSNLTLMTQVMTQCRLSRYSEICFSSSTQLALRGEFLRKTEGSVPERTQYLLPSGPLTTMFVFFPRLPPPSQYGAPVELSSSRSETSGWYPGATIGLCVEP